MQRYKKKSKKQKNATQPSVPCGSQAPPDRDKDNKKTKKIIHRWEKKRNFATQSIQKISHSVLTINKQQKITNKQKNEKNLYHFILHYCKHWHCPVCKNNKNCGRTQRETALVGHIRSRKTSI